MGAVADRANQFIGVSRSVYVCNELVNEILNHNKNVGVLAIDYLTWGVAAHGPGEGVVVVGKDGKHVGLFVNDHEFVHSSVSAHQVIKRGTEQLNWAFPNGWVYRKSSY